MISDPLKNPIFITIKDLNLQQFLSSTTRNTTKTPKRQQHIFNNNSNAMLYGLNDLATYWLLDYLVRLHLIYPLHQYHWQYSHFQNLYLYPQALNQP